MRSRMSLIAVVLIGVVLAGAARMQPAGEPPYTTEFRLQDCDFVTHGKSPYFSLKPGTVWRYEGDDGGEFVELEIKVLHQTKWIKVKINGQEKWIKTRVVREREWVDEELVEVSLNYFARCQRTGNIFYFGEDVDIYKNGTIISHQGAWLAGKQGAKPGLIMPQLFLLGARYFQEIAPNVAMDRAEHVEMGLTVQTPAGTFHNCVLVRETTPLEPGSEGFKTYAPGVGLIKDGFVELVEFDD